MRKLKRLAASLLAMAVLLTAFAVPASAEGFSFNWDSDDNTSPHCKSLLMLNLDTDTVVYAMNPDEKLPMASLTKIMTYIVAYETIPNMENTKITVPQSVSDDLEGTGSSLAGVEVGEILTGLQLLYLMMVPSGNDAALTLAEYVDAQYAAGKLEPKEISSEAASGTDPAGTGTDAADSKTPSTGDASVAGSSVGEPDNSPEEDNGSSEFDPTDYTGTYFIKLMNEKAKELGCDNTNFTNPHGLHNENHYSTARDMAVITKYAMSLPNFTEITGTAAYVKPATNMSSEESTKTTTNKLLLNYADESGYIYYYQYATGIKTGSHDQAGYCITASATAYGYTYVVVALGSPSVDENGDETGVHGEMLDARSLFRWALTSLEKKTVAAQGDILGEVKLDYAWKKDTLQLAAGENAAVMLPDSVDASSILVNTENIPQSVQAPIKKGEQVGTATLSYAGEVIATVPLVAAESVEKSEMLAGFTQTKEVFTSPWFLVIIAVVAVLIIVYIILIFLYRKKQKQLRRVKKFRDM